MEAKSSLEWMDQFGIELVGYVEHEDPDIVILDPDGWDRTELDKELEMEIEFGDFRQRILRCTIEASEEFFLEGLNNGGKS